MPRSRNIKPGFFHNEDLLECDFPARILFAGLWCWADRAGRLEDRPKKFKIEIFPGDDCDVNSLLKQLEARKLILRYETNGTRYIQVVNFAKHQNPHKTEALSIIPSPYENGADTLQEQDLHSTSTVQEQNKHTTNRADSLLLIPDSLLLIPDSLLLIPDSLLLIPDSLDNKTTNADAPARPPEIELTALAVENIAEWVTQQAVSGNPIIVDIRQELEKFRTHYLAYGGKDGAGRVPASWSAMFGKWLLKANTEAKIGGRGNEKTKRNQSGAVATSSPGNRSPGAGDKPTWKSEGERIAAAYLSGEKQ